METSARSDESAGRDPAATYRDRAATFGARREEQEHRHRVLAYLRVIVFLASASLVVVPAWRGPASKQIGDLQSARSPPRGTTPGKHRDAGGG